MWHASLFVSDRRTLLLAGIPLCKSQELSQIKYSISLLCIIHHDFPVTLHTPGTYGQFSVSDHNGDKQLGVAGQDVGLGGLGMAKSGDYNFLSPG